MKKAGPGLSNVMMVRPPSALSAVCCALIARRAAQVGDRRKFNSALIGLHQELDEKTGLFTPNLVGPSKAVSPNSTTVEQAMKDPVWKEYIEAAIKKANAQAVSNASQIKAWRIVPTDFSVAGDELTPTLKLKRSVVAQKYAAVIEEIYAGAGGD